MKTIKELEAEIKEHIKKREQQGEIYLDDVEDNFKLQTEMAKKEKMAQVKTLEDVLKLIYERIAKLEHCRNTCESQELDTLEELKARIEEKNDKIRI